MFGGKLVVGWREDLFFGLHPMFGGKLDVGAPEDDFEGGHALVRTRMQHFCYLLYEKLIGNHSERLETNMRMNSLLVTVSNF